jgi:hypothetical protein
MMPPANDPSGVKANRDVLGECFPPSAAREAGSHRFTAGRCVGAAAQRIHSPPDRVDGWSAANGENGQGGDVTMTEQRSGTGMAVFPDGASTAELVKLASEQISRLVREELALARTEMTAKAKRAGSGAGLFGGAGVVALYGAAALLTPWSCCWRW